MTTLPLEGKYTSYLLGKAARMGVPLNGTFELTPCCNMACKMCYVRLTKEQQEAIGPLHTAEEWIQLGKIARDQGMLYLLLTGGEPFLHPQFREILEGLHQLGLVISINTNGTLIDASVIDWLKKVPPFRINLTLYGASDETYQRLCGNPKGFTQVTNAIRLLQDAGITVKLNCSVTPYNQSDLEEIFAFAEQHQLVVQANSYMFPPVRKDASLIGVNQRFEPEEAAYQAAKIQALLHGKEAFIRRAKENIPMLDPDESCAALPETGEGMRCRAGKCSFWITWEGSMLPCGMFCAAKAPNVFREDFSNAWCTARSLAASVRLPQECAVCTYKDACQTCAAMVYTETGCFDRRPEYRCRMAKAYPAACQKLAQQLKEEQEVQNP